MRSEDASLSAPFTAVTKDAEAARATVAATGQAVSIVTEMDFAAPPDDVWNGLMFYEEIAQHPPLPLRLLLPRPVRTEGRKSHLGDEAKCLYEGGHLRKRVTRIDRGRYYAFEVVEQNLVLGGPRLLSGGYTLRALASGHTEVALRTSYMSAKRPRWLWKRIEAAVCHAFHRHILRAMRSTVESADPHLAGTSDDRSASSLLSGDSTESERAEQANSRLRRMSLEEHRTSGSSNWFCKAAYGNDRREHLLCTRCRQQIQP